MGEQELLPGAGYGDEEGGAFIVMVRPEHFAFHGHNGDSVEFEALALVDRHDPQALLSAKPGKRRSGSVFVGE